MSAILLFNKPGPAFISSIAVNQMILKHFPDSISTVHFKKQLTRIHNILILPNPVRRNNSYSSILSSESAQLENPYLTQTFCSHTLKESARLGIPFQGKQIHSVIVKLGYCNVLSFQNKILNFYVKCKEFLDACLLFDETSVRNVVTWNTLINGLVDCGAQLGFISYPGFYYFRRMLAEGVWPDYITYSSLFKMCIELGDVEIGRELHCCVVKSGWGESCFVICGAVDLYGKLEFIEEARQVFNGVVKRDLVLWNVMVSCYALNRLGDEGFGVFGLMRLEGVQGDHFTYTSLLNMCASLGYFDSGRQIHGLIIRLCLDWDLVIASAIVDMYAKNESVIDARKVFDKMVVKNMVSWTTMIVGYGQFGKGNEAANIFVEMLREGFRPDELTIASVVSSCGNLCFIAEILQLHGYALKSGLLTFLSIANALISAHAKCGSVISAYKSFSSIQNPDLVSFTSMIGAYAFHGLALEAIELFEKALSNGVTPDGIIFLEALAACSHGGLVKEGLHYFTSMINDHQIGPTSDHYSCLIDLISRVGLLNEAFNVLTSMPIEPGPETLGAFIGACKIHGNVELTKWAAEKLFVLEPNKNVNYTLVSNMYAFAGRWDDVARTRKMMRERCYNKVRGSSWIEIYGKVFTFVSSDKSHPETPMVYAVLGLLFKLMKEKEFNQVWISCVEDG